MIDTQCTLTILIFFTLGFMRNRSTELSEMNLFDSSGLQLIHGATAQEKVYIRLPEFGCGPGQVI